MLVEFDDVGVPPRTSDALQSMPFSRDEAELGGAQLVLTNPP
jgi:hypothetical protein